MRYQGKVKTWKDEKGFGFVVPNGGGSDVFLHISAFSNRHKRPAVGNLVTYELSAEDPNRLEAKNVRFVGEREHHKSSTLTALPFLFVGILV